MKVVKRIVTVLVLVLAVVGVFSLLKKAPNLAPSEDDVLYLERELGKSASTTPSQEGLSGVMMNVEGAPPITGFEMTGASSTPPPFMSSASTAAPEFAPAFSPNSDSAPPFMPAASAPAVASPYQPLEAAPAFEAPPLPQISPAAPSPAEPEPVPVSVTTPGTSVYECSVLEPIVPPLKSSPPRTESPPPFQEVPLAWNGPATEVINMPSSDSNEPQEGCDVLEVTSSEQNNTPGTVWGSPELLRNETPIVALSPYKRLPVVMETPNIKFIPAVEEEEIPADSPSTELAAADLPKIVDTPKTTKRAAVPVDDPSTREHYRHTSVRKNIAFSDSLEPEKVEEPIISFSTPKTGDPAEASDSRPAVPAPVETKAVPFAKSDTLSVQPPERVHATAPTAVPPASLETDLSKVLRPTVTRFVKAQSTLANSGNPVKMRNAFIQLSKLYEQSELNDDERAYMKPLLDRLALAVVYSRNIHILEPTYHARSGDTVESIAEAHQISPALLRKINGLTETQTTAPGAELKVVQGRFDAKISGSRGELTLLLGGLYAGCFPIQSEKNDLQGEFYVTSKQARALTLNNGMTICDDKFAGTPNVIRLKEQDFRELFDILTEMSVIVFEN